MTFGGSPFWTFGILQTRKSPSAVCAASISDLDFEDELCQARPTIVEGAFGLISVCTMVNEGWRQAMRIDPFWYLRVGLALLKTSASFLLQTLWHMSASLERVPTQ